MAAARLCHTEDLTDVERLYRETMLLRGEGTGHIQWMLIGRRLLENYKLT